MVRYFNKEINSTINALCAPSVFHLKLIEFICFKRTLYLRLLSTGYSFFFFIGLVALDYISYIYGYVSSNIYSSLVLFHLSLKRIWRQQFWLVILLF